jgi:hypothetical protein
MEDASVQATSASTKGDLAARQTLRRYARDTWASFDAMTDPKTGLPADSLSVEGERSVQTSTTNIGAYMWSAVVAEKLGIISHDEAVARLSKTIGTLEEMERHKPSGQFYNWYDARTGEKLTYWPPAGEPLTPILLPVDNGWLATGLEIVRNGAPELSARSGALYDSMDFGFYYRPEVNRILFHYAPDTGSAPCCYDTVVSESRIASYIGISKGELPKREYFGTWRTFLEHLRLELPGNEAGRVLPHLLRRPRVRGGLPVQRLAHRSQLGWEHVRGPHAGVVSPRRAVGT